MRALVTGGCGFIGSHLVRRLLADGLDVTILDDLSTGRRGNIDGLDVRLVEASIEDSEALRDALDGVQSVFHLAAMISVPVSIEQPAACMQTNVVGTAEVLDAARSGGVRTFVFASSAAVYGDGGAGVQHEDAPSRPSSPYGVSKRTGEQLCATFDGPELRTVCLRFFNVYGPRQDPNSPYASVVPAFATRARRGDPLVIFGDGEQTRDFVQVSDVVGAAVHCANHPTLRGIANVGTGLGVSVNELASQIVRLMGSSSPIAYGPPRQGDVAHSVASVERLRASGWAPRCSLEEGLRATLVDYA